MAREPEALLAEATVHWRAGRAAEALATLDAAIAARPSYAEAYYNRGTMLQQLWRLDEALASLDRALWLKPDLTAAWNNRAMVMTLLGRHGEAAEACEKVLAQSPRNASAHYNYGLALEKTGRHARAMESFAQALALDPSHPTAFGCLAGAALHVCDFAAVARLTGAVESGVADGGAVIAPLLFLGYCGDNALQKRCAENYMQPMLALPRMPPRAPEKRRRIRIAYVSDDFHEHAIGYLTAELFERHDRARFEVIGISHGGRENGPQRARIAKGFDAFHDIARRSDREAAVLLRQLEVDIAIDLKGHTAGARSAIFAHRPCPVQVEYLGYPGTMGCDFFDYAVVDPVVAPPGDEVFYSEALVRMPASYQVNDSTRPRPPAPPRAEVGLPEEGFVFCSFNNNWKITEAVFDVWMRLLTAVPGSVLWLLSDNDTARANLCAAAQARGVAASRLIFAPRVALEAHMARQGAADLFLDTLLYNAHTTASDALWMGLPLVTCRGSSFAGRVAASLLNAVGLPELVTQTLEEYEALALALARDPQRLAALKQKLLSNLSTTPLFNTAAFTRQLESAYERMWDRALAGARPEGFAAAAD